MITAHPLYPTIDGYGRIRRPARVLTFVFLLLLPALAAAGGAALGVLGLVTLADLGIFAGMYLLTGFGTTVGYHRLFTHRSFEAPRPVRWVLAILGCMNAQGAPIIWAAQHRRHHACSDKVGDPHSPHEGHGPGLWNTLKGLWHSHIGHIFNQVEPIEPERYVPDLERDGFLRWMEKWSALPVILGMLLPFGAGWLLSGSWIGGLTGLLWGGWIRLFVITHATGSVNSLCHFFGSRRFETEDRAGNVAWLVPATLGECWHHNHHVFPTSARHGLGWWELDPAWIVIWTMEKLRLARKVVRISKERQKEKIAA
jgi:stearoyl-CoA desaturase (delta-9 desaturase)